MGIGYISKELAKQLIEEAPGDTIMILTYDKDIGISDMGKYVTKARGKKLVNNAGVLIKNESEIVNTINLHNIKNLGLSENIVKSIILVRL